MSREDDDQPQDCASRKGITLSKLVKNLCLVILSLSLILLLGCFILYPSKPPHFSLKEADLNQLSISTPSLLNSSIQLTLQSHNPSKILRIYYDELLLDASYKGQRITSETAIPPFYQGEKETTTLSALLIGSQQPVDPSFAYEVQRDHGAGMLALTFEGMGKLKWEVGPFVSKRSRFVVNCVAVMPVGVPLPSPPLRTKQGSKCSTSM